MTTGTGDAPRADDGGRGGGGADWGARCARWSGIRSETVVGAGLRGHVLRAAATGPAAARDAPTQLLVPPLGAGAWSWLEVIRPLAASGPVLAVDLPGSGRTRPVRRPFGRAEDGARFLCDLMAELDLRRVVLHGHSMGALVAVLAADLAGPRVERLVLVDPPLPGWPDPPRTLARYRTVGRVVLVGAAPVVRLLVRVGMGPKARLVRRWLNDPAGRQAVRAFGRMGTDPAAISPEFRAVLADELVRYRQGWRADAAAAGIVSAFAALTVRQEEVRAVIDRVRVPTLLIWGARDPVIPRVLVDELLQRRPDWQLRVVPAGHVPPWEAPDAYVDAVGRWLSA